jgi:hypothetical protein
MSRPAQRSASRTASLYRPLNKGQRWARKYHLPLGDLSDLRELVFGLVDPGFGPALSAPNRNVRFSSATGRSFSRICYSEAPLATLSQPVFGPA